MESGLANWFKKNKLLGILSILAVILVSLGLYLVKSENKWETEFGKSLLSLGMTVVIGTERTTLPCQTNSWFMRN